MKKEAVVTALFVALIVYAFYTNIYLKKLTDDVLNLCMAAMSAVENNDWETAAGLALEASELWDNCDKQTHIILRHSVIENIDTILNSYYGYINARNRAEAEAVLRSVRVLICGVEQAERISAGSIF